MKKSNDKQKMITYLKNQVKFMKGIIITCITFIILYTVVQTILSYVLMMELSPTLTTCVYTFFGTELAACAFIKIFGKDDKDNTNQSVGGIDIHNGNMSDG